VGGAQGFAVVTAQDGDTNIVVTLEQSMAAPTDKRPASLKGRPGPDLTSVGVSSDLTAAGKPVLVCLFDVEQRPSRRLIRLLGERYESLTRNGVQVVAVQAALVSEQTFTEWMRSNKVAFPIGRVTEKSKETVWASDVRSLPWLILIDGQGKVAAEGFGLEELESKLAELKN
ncbi:MAG: thioredoxin-like domain-containing protein, partial [Verrucomicrobiae bacterium]|nr:thioredoxin-like domain-containing protein [Verrucomicrobiae bacterium]